MDKERPPKAQRRARRVIRKETQILRFAQEAWRPKEPRERTSSLTPKEKQFGKRLITLGIPLILLAKRERPAPKPEDAVRPETTTL